MHSWSSTMPPTVTFQRASTPPLCLIATTVTRFSPLAATILPTRASWASAQTLSTRTSARGPPSQSRDEGSPDLCIYHPACARLNFSAMSCVGLRSHGLPLPPPSPRAAWLLRTTAAMSLAVSDGACTVRTLAEPALDTNRGPSSASASTFRPRWAPGGGLSSRSAEPPASKTSPPLERETRRTCSGSTSLWQRRCRAT